MKDFLGCLFKLSLLCVLLSLCAGASAQCKLTTLNIPWAYACESLGINDWGAIVGAFWSSTMNFRGFLLFQGKLTHFNFPAWTRSLPRTSTTTARSWAVNSDPS